MWGGPTPHNLVTLSLCCAVRTCSEVPITSSDRDTTEAREGRPHSPSLGHPCPGAGSSFTQREVPYDWVSAPRPTPPDASWDHAGDTTHFGRNENKKKDYGRTAQSWGYCLMLLYFVHMEVYCRETIIRALPNDI